MSAVKTQTGLLRVDNSHSVRSTKAYQRAKGGLRIWQNLAQLDPTVLNALTRLAENWGHLAAVSTSTGSPT